MFTRDIFLDREIGRRVQLIIDKEIDESRKILSDIFLTRFFERLQKLKGNIFHIIKK